jgi:cell division protein FtsB
MTKTIEQLNAEIAALSGQRKVLKEKMHKLVAGRDMLAARETTRKTLTAMSPAEREALKAALDKQQKIAPAAV